MAPRTLSSLFAGRLTAALLALAFLALALAAGLGAVLASQRSSAGPHAPAAADAKAHVL